MQFLFEVFGTTRLGGREARDSLTPRFLSTHTTKSIDPTNHNIATKCKTHKIVHYFQWLTLITEFL